MIRLPVNSRVTDVCQNLIAAEKLLKLGARPPIVSYLCNLGRKLTIRLFKDIHQRAPKQGMLPYDAFWIGRSAVNDIHASIFMGLMHDLSRLQKQPGLHAQTFITAYELYQQIVAKNVHPSKREAGNSRLLLLDINRAWQLIQQFNSGNICFESCKQCSARYLTVKHLPNAFHQCPLCDVWADRIGRRRWITVSPRHDV